ncbi:MAG: oligosaccharide flippase family protein [Phycisphaeraceae bacterium]
MSRQPTTSTLSLRALTLRGSAWVGLGYALQQALRLGGNLVLARLLFPEAFGLMALVNAFVQGLEMFSDLGIKPGVIRSSRTDEALLNTAWTLQVMRGCVLWLVSCVIAWPLAQLYGQPMLAQLLPVAGLTALLVSLNSTAVLLRHRRLAMGGLMAARVTAQALGLLVMIVIAWRYQTVWALVVGGVVATAAMAVFSHTFLWETPIHFRWDRAAVGELLSFGKWIMLSTAMAFLAAQADRLLLGLYVTAGTLGLYAIAYMLSEAAGKAVSQISHSVLMPAFSRVARDNPERLSGAYRRARDRLDALVLPVAGFLMTAGDRVVALLYDPRYIEAGWMLQVLSLRLVAYCLLPPSAVCLMALGKPQYAASASAAKAGCLFVGVPLGWMTGELPGAVWAVALAEFAGWPLMMRGLRQESLNHPLREVACVPWLLLGTAAGWAFIMLS